MNAIKSLASIASALSLVFLVGCAVQPQQPVPAQAVCQLSPTKTVYTASDADCAGLKQALRQRQETQTSAGTQAPASGGGPRYSDEMAGDGDCRLRSDGNARLKTNPAKAYPRGHVLATPSSSPEFSKKSGEDCTAWRHRIGALIIY